jgi:hypothetical protein
MRPGYTVLIEWGWAPYLNENGKIENNIEFYDGVLKGGKTREQVWLEVYELSKKKYHNYDAMYGYVKNYNWTARMDGGYDCTTTIISVGEIMESLKAGYLPFDLKDAAEKNIGDDSEFSKKPSIIEQTTSFYSKNKLAGLCKSLYNVCFNNRIDDNGNHFTFKPSKSVLETPYNMFVFNYLLSDEGDDDGFSHKHIQGYITLESFIDMLNSYVLLHGGKDESNTTPIITLSTKSSKYEDEDKNKPLLCLAHPLQVSVDPTVCLITNPLWAKGIDFTDINIGAENGASNRSTKYDNSAKQIYKLLRDVGLGNEDPIGQKLIDTIGFGKPGYLLQNAKDFVKSFYFAAKDAKPDIGASTISEYALGLLSKLTGIKGVVGSNVEQIKETDDTYRNLFTITNFKAAEDEDKAAEEEEKKKAKEVAAKAARGSNPGEIEYLTNLEKNNSANSFQNKKEANSETGFIGNIYLNIAFLYKMSIESSIYDSKTRDLKLYDYLIKILKEVQESIGGVNNFEIHVDPIDNVARIIDVNYVDTISKEDAYEKAFQIEAQNLSGTVRSYNLQSKIFPEQGAMIAIGAQVKGGNTQGTSVNTLLDFNNGLEDRIIPKKLEPFTSTSSNFDSKYEKLKNSINRIKEFFLPSPKEPKSDGTPASTNQASNSEYKSALRNLIIYFQEIGETNTNGRSIIPVQISLTMDGIGGLVIGHLFKIPPDLLPKGYGIDNIGGRLIQTITTINHKVENGDWTTTIDALNIVTRDSSNDRERIKFNDLLTEGKDSFIVKVPQGECTEPYKNTNLNKGWTGKQVAFIRTTINPAIEGPKLTKKYGKILAQAVMAVIQKEQSFKGFNYNLGGFDITDGGWSYNDKLHNGYVVVREGGTKLCKAFISFKDFDSFVEQSISSFKSKGFEKATSAETFGKLWYEKWNGFGARALKPANVLMVDWDAKQIAIAAGVWNSNAKYV